MVREGAQGSVRSRTQISELLSARWPKTLRSLGPSERGNAYCRSSRATTSSPPPTNFATRGGPLIVQTPPFNLELLSMRNELNHQRCLASNGAQQTLTSLTLLPGLRGRWILPGPPKRWRTSLSSCSRRARRNRYVRSYLRVRMLNFSNQFSRNVLGQKREWDGVLFSCLQINWTIINLQFVQQSLRQRKASWKDQRSDSSRGAWSEDLRQFSRRRKTPWLVSEWRKGLLEPLPKTSSARRITPQSLL